VSRFTTRNCPAPDRVAPCSSGAEPFGIALRPCLLDGAALDRPPSRRSGILPKVFATLRRALLLSGPVDQMHQRVALPPLHLEYAAASLPTIRTRLPSAIPASTR
jgi:hypothetical protein